MVDIISALQIISLTLNNLSRKRDGEAIALGTWDLHRHQGCCGPPLAQRLLQDTGRRVRSSAPSPTRAGRAVQHQEGPRWWKSLGGIETKWETPRGSICPLGLWTLAPEKLGIRAIGEGKSEAMSDHDSVSRLVGKLGCVQIQVLVKNTGQLLCKELLSSSWLTPRVI